MASDPRESVSGVLWCDMRRASRPTRRCRAISRARSRFICGWVFNFESAAKPERVKSIARRYRTCERVEVRACERSFMPNIRPR